MKSYLLKYFLPCLLFLISFVSFSQQQSKIDSLKNLLKTTIDDTTRIKTLNALAWKLKYNNPDTAIYYSKQALTLAKKAKWEKGIANSYRKLGVFNHLKGNYPLAIDHYNKALKINIQLNDKKGIAATFGNIGVVYNEQGDYPKALEYYFKALKMDEEIGDKRGAATNISNIGLVYHEQGDYPKALEYYFKALKANKEIGRKNGVAIVLSNIGNVYNWQVDYPKALEYYFKALKMDEELGNKNGTAYDLGNIGLVYYEQGDYPKALEYYFKALKIDEELGNKNGTARHISNIGIVYYEQGDYPKALEYYFKALKMDEELDNKSGIAITLSNIGKLYTEQKKYPEAERYLLQALEVSTDIGALLRIKEHHQYLSELYAKTRRYQKAYEHYKKYSIAKDTLYNEEKSKEIGKLEAGYEYEIKIQKQRLKQEKKEALAEERANKQRIIIWSVSGGLLLVVVFFLLLFNRFRIIRTQKNIIQEQKALVDEKNKNITDSIRYAKEIQEAILPTDEEIAELLPESFVLFKPKDIVSGDFYWAIQTKNNKVIWAAADCTGHGVPGAFMSMIGNALLNEIVIEKGITEPAQILNKLKTHIINSLSQKGESGEHRDGMDIALCALDKKTNKLEFAGAYNSLLLVRKDIANSEIGKNGKLKIFEEDLGELKADRQPIGYEHGKDQPFTNHEIQLQKGDTLYTFSDGYADQYGGDANSSFGNGKKFSKRRLKELVLSLQQKSMTEQKETFDTTIENYKGDLEQIDDILVIGVRI